MDTLIVHRDWQSAYNQTTVLKDCNNKVKVIINSSIKQPKMNCKTITVKGIEYSLDWGLIGRKKKNKVNIKNR